MTEYLQNKGSDLVLRKNVYSNRLGIIFVIFLFVTIFSSCKKEPAKVEETERTGKRVMAKAIEIKEIKEEKFLYASHDKRDPFVPLVDKRGVPVSVVKGGVHPSNLYLEGIIWDDVKPMAIINGEVVSSGDKIMGVTIIKIEKDRVIVNYQNETFDLKMD